MKDLEKQRASKRRWKAAHPEWQKQWNAAHPEKVRNWSKLSAIKWNAEHPEECRKAARQQRRNRRARERNAEGKFTDQEFNLLKAFYANTCLCCLRHENELLVLGLQLVPDHVLPLAKGGSNDISNIQPLCNGKGGCNNRKGVKYEDYRGRNAIDRTR